MGYSLQVEFKGGDFTMSPWHEIEEFYKFGLRREGWRVFNEHMLQVVNMLKETLDREKYGVGLSMFKLAIWLKTDVTKVFHISWDKDTDEYIIETDNFSGPEITSKLNEISEKLNEVLKQLDD